MGIIFVTETGVKKQRMRLQRRIRCTAMGRLLITDFPQLPVPDQFTGAAFQRGDQRPTVADPVVKYHAAPAGALHPVGVRAREHIQIISASECQRLVVPARILFAAQITVVIDFDAVEL